MMQPTSIWFVNVYAGLHRQFCGAGSRTREIADALAAVSSKRRLYRLRVVLKPNAIQEHWV